MYILQTDCAMPAGSRLQAIIKTVVLNLSTEEPWLQVRFMSRGDLRRSSQAYAFNPLQQLQNPGWQTLTEQPSSDNPVSLEFESKGFSYNGSGLRNFHMNMVRGQFHGDLSIEVNDHKEFLRLLLIVYYLVDPVACPVLLREEHFEVLYLLMHVAPGENDPRFKTATLCYRFVDWSIIGAPKLPLLSANG